MKVYKITPEPGFNSCTECTIDALAEWFEQSNAGDKYTIEVQEMSEKDYLSLPEYMGP